MHNGDEMKFYIVDVFAEEKYAGNQLAVIRGAQGLSDAQMQTLALEMNYSETTFILSDASRDAGYDVRIFTPAEEVPFAGHPTLGTAYVIQQEIIGEPVDSVTLNLAVGQIPVKIGYSEDVPTELWMHQKPPDFGETFLPDALATVLNLQAEDIDTRFPIQDVSTGLPFVIVPLCSKDAVNRCKINVDAFDRLVENGRAKDIFVFCPETENPENNLHARMFARHFYIVEDPATGSANGCLAGYLVKHRYFGADRIDVRVEQGYQINRPSLLMLQAEAKPDTIDVFVGGNVIKVAEGKLV